MDLYMVCSHELMCLRMTGSGETNSFQPLDVGAGTEFKSFTRSVHFILRSIPQNL